MEYTEQQLKKQLKEQPAAGVYLFYGEETYLIAHYVNAVIQSVVGKEDDGLGEFNLQYFDGQEASFDTISEAVEALPLMADKKCVVVRDWNMAAPGEQGERMLELLRQPPESTVLILRMETVKPDFKKNAKWKKTAQALETNGVMVNFGHKTTGDIVKLLCSGATRRGSQLAPDTARQLVEQCGDDLNLLLNELDKLCALAGDGEITPTMLESVATKNVEAQVYDLSKMILQHHFENAYLIIHRLFAQKAEPVNILAALSGAYADLYRAKVAFIGNVPAEQLSADFAAYKGREFRLRYAARDCRSLSVTVLRKSLDILAQADTTLKSSRADTRTVIEQTAARLILTAKMG